MTSDAEAPGPSPQAFSYPSFRFFWTTTLCGSFAAQIMSVSVGWQIYDVTGEAYLLGLVGLAQFLPALLLVLVTGMAADHFPRRRIIQIAFTVEIGCALALFTLAGAKAYEVWPIFVVLVVLGTARAFVQPAASSLAPNIVPPRALANAISMNVTAWQLATILGPVAGGLLYGVGAPFAFGTAGVLAFVAAVSMGFVRQPVQKKSDQETSVETETSEH